MLSPGPPERSFDLHGICYFLPPDSSVAEGRDGCNFQRMARLEKGRSLGEKLYKWVGFSPGLITVV